MPSPRLANVIAVVITIAWFASVILDAAWPAYTPPFTVHALMAAVAGWAFSTGYIARHEGKESNGKLNGGTT